MTNGNGTNGNGTGGNGAGAVRNEAEERQKAIALLEATHQFPVEYHLSVIALNQPAVAAALRAVIEACNGRPLPDDAYETVASSGAKYLSHRARVRCATAADVLELYRRVKQVEGVVTVL